jgi:hypothetical protein
MKEIENRLDKMSDENDKLKKIVAEKELDILRPQRKIKKIRPKKIAK